MTSNGSSLQSRETNDAKEKLLLSPHDDDKSLGTPLIKIRTPGRNSRSNYFNFIRLKRFDLFSEDFPPHVAAKEGQLKTLMDLKESGESLEERDSNGFGPIHHAVRANQLAVIEFLLDNGVDANSEGGYNLLTPLHISVR